jgi:hypothetical protein
MIQHQSFRFKYLKTIRQIAAGSSFTLSLIFSFGAMAQTDAAPAKPAAPAAASSAGKPAKRTTINFEDQLVEGQTQKPELFYLLQQRNNNFKRLIRPRENFLPEMRKTSESVGRPGAGKGSDN